MSLQLQNQSEWEEFILDQVNQSFEEQNQHQILQQLPLPTSLHQPSLLQPIFPLLLSQHETSAQLALNISIKSHQPNFKSSIQQCLNDSKSPSYHNFQKHTVTAVRRIVNFLKDSSKSIEQAVAQQMWKIFLASGLKSKKILIILFGEANLDDQKYRNLLKSCYFGEICRYRQDVIRKAQQILRNFAIHKITDKAIDEYLECKNQVHLKKQFSLYLRNFVQMMRQGPLTSFRLKLRVSREMKSQMGEINFQLNQTLQDQVYCDQDN